MERWTQTDERQLAEMLERKRRALEVARLPVHQAVNDFHYRDMSTDSLVTELIKHADRITQVLEPFTSKPEAE